MQSRILEAVPLPAVLVAIVADYAARTLLDKIIIYFGRHDRMLVQHGSDSLQITPYTRDVYGCYLIQYDGSFFSTVTQDALVDCIAHGFIGGLIFKTSVCRYDAEFRAAIMAELDAVDAAD